MDEDTEKFFSAIIIVFCISGVALLSLAAWLVSR